MSKFLMLAGKDVSAVAKTVEGNAYIPWAAALQYAGSPKQSVVTFGATGPVREIFGGAVVAVDQATEGGPMQRTTLVVTNARGEPIPFGELSSKDLGNTINRCRARAVAMVQGLGISLYSKCGPDGPGYVTALAVRPDTPDLRKIDPLIEQKIDKKTKKVLAEYLGWFSALSAARITDPSFVWEALEFDGVDDTGQARTLPALRVPGKGWMVAVRTVWHEQEHVEWLPIMGVAIVQTKNGPKPLDYQALESPTVADWHKAVMRALAKSISIQTGYGIEMYGDEVPDDIELQPADDISTATPGVGGDEALAADDNTIAPLIERLKALMTITATSEAKVLGFLGAASIEEAEAEGLNKTIAFLELAATKAGTPA